MAVKMDVNLRNVQEQVGDNVQQARRLSYKAALAYVGLFGMAYDAAVSALESGAEFVDKAEKRGEKMEQEFNDYLAKYQDQAADEAKKLRQRVEQQIDDVSKELHDSRQSLEQEVEKILAKMNFPRFSASVDTEVVQVDIEVTSMEPIEGYDEMNVKEVTEALDGLDTEMLAAVRTYEVATKNRVTVLREIDERLAPVEEPAA